MDGAAKHEVRCPYTGEVMAFRLPQGLNVKTQQQLSSDQQVALFEDSLGSDQRVLVGVGIAWPNWLPGWNLFADHVAEEVGNWIASNLAGLRRWPELNRVVMRDMDGEHVLWVAYLSSPAWWLVIAGVLLALVSFAITFRLVAWIAPEVAQPVNTLLDIAPLLGMLLVVQIVGSFGPVLQSGEGG